MTNIAIENGTFIVDLPIKDGDFPVRKLLVYQRVGRIRVLVFWKMMPQYHTGGISRGCGCNLVTSWDSPGQMWSLPTVPNCHSRETSTLFTSIFTRQAVIIFVNQQFLDVFWGTYNAYRFTSRRFLWKKHLQKQWSQRSIQLPVSCWMSTFTNDFPVSPLFWSIDFVQIGITERCS